MLIFSCIWSDNKNMRLYHYIIKGNDALEKGILSFAQNPNADLSYYYKRSAQSTHQGIIQWMESCFTGRSRGIRAFSEPIQWTKKSLNLKNFIEQADLFSIDVNALKQDGLIDAVYVSPSVLDMPELNEELNCDEVLLKLSDIDEIDYTPVDWSVCDDELGRRFAFVRYYLIIVKGGVILPQYIKKENQS